MRPSKLRKRIAWEAARLMYERQEAEYLRAKQKAARHLCKGWVKPADLPSNVEIRDQIQSLARQHEGEARTDGLRQMRLQALRMMRLLDRFRPRLVGSVLTGHVRKGSDVDLHVFSDSTSAVTGVLEFEGLRYEVERRRIRKDHQERVFTHIRLHEVFPFDITVYASNQAHRVQRSSITGRPMERADVGELERLLADEYPEMRLEEMLAEVENTTDRFLLYESLLLPLEGVKQNVRFHPEGDALYHSLQVFDLACDELPYDEEFLLAALLHDVGKAVDPADHVAATLQSLDGFITERTAWLIEHHMQAHWFNEGTLGARARRRLQKSPHFEDLLLLAQCDQDGRRPGVEAPELEEAITYLRDLAETYGG